MRSSTTLPKTVFFVLALCLCGCHARNHDGFTIAVIPKTTATNVWKSMHIAILEDAKNYPCKIEWNAPESEADYTQQASMVEDAVYRHVSGIILAPDHQLVLASSVKLAKEAGIPVVILDAPISLPTDDYTAFIGSDDVEIGALAADRIGLKLHGSGQVGIIGVSPTLEGSNRREDAFIQRLKERFPQIVVVDIEYGLSDWARSSRAAQDMVDKYPKLDAMFVSDGFATSGAASVLEAHRSVRHIVLVGVDQEGYTLQAVREGLVDSVIVKDSNTMGHLAMLTMMAALQHKPFNKRLYVPVALITQREVDSPQLKRLLPPHFVSPVNAPPSR